MPPLHWMLFCFQVITIQPSFVHGHQSRQKGNHLDSDEKFTNFLRRLAPFTFFFPLSSISVLISRRIRMYKYPWIMTSTRSSEMLTSSPNDLNEIFRSSEISSWNWSVFSGLVTVLFRPRRGAENVEKSPHLCGPHISWRWYTKLHLPLMFLSEWREIPWETCNGGKKTRWWLAPRFCWNFYRTKDISNELLWVFVALIIELAKPMCRILLSSINYQTVPYNSFRLFLYIFTLFTYGKNLWKELLSI